MVTLKHKSRADTKTTGKKNGNWGEKKKKKTQIHRSMEQKWEPRAKHTYMWSTHLWQKSQNYTTEIGRSLQQMVLAKLDSHMQKNETRPSSYTIHKINSKWIKDLNVRPETIKLLNKNYRQYTLTSVLVIYFWICLLKQEATKVKMTEWDIRLKSFCTAKKTTSKIKHNLSNGRRYLQIIYLIRGQYSKYIKNAYNSNNLIK